MGKNFIKQTVISLIVTLVFLGVLLISAGRFNYWPAWAYAGVSLLLSFATRLILRQDEDLQQERTKPGPGTQAWDKKLLGVGLLLNLAVLIVAGLDAGRFHWTPDLAGWWLFPGLALNLAGMLLFLLALAENRFFSAVVRVQSDRGHTVVTTGPYRIVRHPGNAGMIVGTLGLPLLFTSAWCFIPALLSVIVMIVRTSLEDELLARELNGYDDYRRATRFRLLPGIW